MTLPLAGATAAWIHREPLDRALETIAAHGLRRVELFTSAPHLQSTRFDVHDRNRLRRRLADLDLSALSVNPSGLDLNPVSPHSDVRDLTERLIAAEIELAADLGAPFVVLGSGRLHALAPLDRATAFAVLTETYGRLAARAERAGVTLLVETLPYGFLTSGADVLGLVEAVDAPGLALVYDVANVLAFEDPCAGLRAVRSRLGLVHVSDSSPQHWAHTSPGRGELDFTAIATTLRDLGYAGPTVYELMDERHPAPHYGADVDTLVDAGWSR